MPLFNYVCLTNENEKRSGTHEAVSQEALCAALRNDGLIVLKISPVSWSSKVWSYLNRDIQISSGGRNDRQAALALEWGSLIEAGVTVEDALNLSLSGARKKLEQRLLQKLLSDVKAGLSLYAALTNHKAFFSDAFIAIVKSAETSGTLGPSLTRLANDLQLRESLVKDIRNSFIYPAFLTVTALGSIAVLLLVVVPNLEVLFSGRPVSELPFMTKLVLELSHFLQKFGLIILGFFLLFISGVVGARFTHAGRLTGDGLLLKLPLAGKVALSMSIGNYARSLGALLAGGIITSNALPLAAATVPNAYMKKAINDIYERVLAGIALSTALERTGLVPADVINLIRVGEKTGNLAEMLERCAVFHERRAIRLLKTVTNLITPVLTIVFGSMAGLIVYAMLSTILSINELAFQ